MHWSCVTVIDRAGSEHPVSIVNLSILTSSNEWLTMWRMVWIDVYLWSVRRTLLQWFIFSLILSGERESVKDRQSWLAQSFLAHMHGLFKKLRMEKNTVNDDVSVFGLLAAGAWHVWEAGQWNVDVLQSRSNQSSLRFFFHLWPDSFHPPSKRALMKARTA